MGEYSARRQRVSADWLKLPRVVEGSITDTAAEGYVFIISEKTIDGDIFQEFSHEENHADVQ